MGILIYISFSINYLILFLINPGTPDKKYFLENNLNESFQNSRICNICKILIKNDEKIHHCEDCNICIIGYDHHCPWTSKCIGKGNIFYFNGMLIMVSFVFLYFIVCVLLI